HSVSVWPEPSLPRTEGTGKLKRVAIRQWLESGQMPATQRPLSQESGLMGVLQRIAPGRAITPETNLDDLGLSSLERVELMTEIERIRGGSVDESAVAQARSVSELLSLQERKEAEPAGAESFPRWSRSWPARAWRRFVLPTLA